LIPFECSNHLKLEGLQNFANLNNIVEFKRGEDLLGFNFEWNDWEIKKRDLENI
jgi:hypothetical protein